MKMKLVLTSFLSKGKQLRNAHNIPEYLSSLRKSATNLILTEEYGDYMKGIA